MDSDSKAPFIGVDLRADAKTEPKVDHSREATPERSGVRTVQHEEPSEAPRRILPDWLRFGNREARVPLPLTEQAAADDHAAPTEGPMEEFE